MNTDLLELTDALGPAFESKDNIIEFREKLAYTIQARAPSLTRSIKADRATRGRKGLTCEGCGTIEGRSSTSFKHCSGCRQVTYCSPECQRDDWQRHKSFCVTVDPSTPKDGVLRLVRNAIANPCIMLPLKNYVRTILELDTARMAGLKWNLIFTCRTIPDPANPSLCIFQICKVQKEQIPMDSDRVERQLQTGVIGITLTFKSDIPGVNAAIAADEDIIPLMMWTMPAMNPSCIGLVLFNKTIRDDITDVLKLRMRTPIYREAQPDQS